MEETICALATPPGVSGLAVIRVSGETAISVVSKIFTSKTSLDKAESHKILYGRFHDGEKSIDYATAAVFRAPKSFTGENSVEIFCHGGYGVYSQILSALISNGARYAQAGEFTKRAFLNGKIDLTQAEAIADLIHSESKIGANIAAKQYSGGLRKNLTEILETLLKSASLLELEFDFADEDIELIDKKALFELIKTTINYCQTLLDAYYPSQIIRNGYKIGIIGFPNAGKSSLFNALLGKDRAIVSAQPGTTRDYIEEMLHIGNIPIKLVDTAGIRDARDEIEIEGIKLAEQIISESDLIIFINDADKGMGNSDTLVLHFKEKYPEKKTLIVQNKIDKIATLEKRESEIYLSAKNNINLDSLIQAIENLAMANIDLSKEYLINERQKTQIEKIIESLNNSKTLIDQNNETELIAFEIRYALKALGEITGDEMNKETLNYIFSKFCIGK